ncbi:MAG: SDR family oxidoreductase [Alphaproteobacteria bacterium]|nr:SDR family oxidoreductase [Alphaproteobacteria bacterium]
MHVVITGAGGFLGQKLARRLLGGAQLTGPGGARQDVSKLTLFDVVAPAADIARDRRVKVVVGDIGEEKQVQAIVQGDVASVFHLAAVVSAGAEADFDLGMRVNLDGTRYVLEACRKLKSPPRVAFTSSVAVYGGDMPKVIKDDTPLNPQTSYGSQKAIGEFLLNDMSRKGFIDGRALRLPTIVVRPGKPNKAASTWASSIIREPLQGDTVECPVEPSAEMYVLSPRRMVDSFLHAHELPAEKLGFNRALFLPGLTVTVAQMLEGLKKAGGQTAVDRVRFVPDATIRRIVAGWPMRFDAARARGLGFKADDSFDQIVEGFVQDDLRRNAA